MRLVESSPGLGTQGEFRRQQRRLRFLALTVAIWVTVIILARSLLAPISFAIQSATGLAIISALLTFYFSATPARIHLSASALVLSMLLSIFLSLLEIGGITQPVAAIAPALPVLAATLLSPRHGMITLLGILLIYAGFTVWQLAGLPVAKNPLDENGRAIMHLLFISFASTIAFFAVRQQQHDSSEKEADLSEIASHDGLTGALNRRGMEEAMHREIALARRYHHSVSLLFVDVDYFKQYNDFFGHLKGDACLNEVTRVINEQLKRPADVLARTGGDEFMVLLPNTPLDAALALAEGMRAAVEALNISSPNADLGRETVTIGVACADEEAYLNVELLSQAADDGLYAAKRSGRNQVACGTFTALR